MNKQYFDTDYFEFFIELTLNNQKSWFDENRKRYEKSVKAPFATFIDALIHRMALTNEDFLSLNAKDCIFRINRDIRFSKDKTPYKTHCSASIHVGGRKSMFPGGMYIEIGAEKCALYTGVYMPEKDELMMFRRNIANHLRDFQSAINEPNFVKYFGKVLGDKNKIIDVTLRPQAVLEPLIFNKQFYVMHEFEAEKCFEIDFLDYLISVWKSAQNFNSILSISN